MLASELGATSEPPLLTSPTSIKLSSTFNVSVFKIDCVPRTVRLPVMVALVETVRAPVTASVEPSNVRFALSSSSPEVPAITTLLSVKSLIAAELATKPPAILAPLSTSNTSIFAVPSKCKSLNSKPDAPKSTALSVRGNM